MTKRVNFVLAILAVLAVITVVQVVIEGNGDSSPPTASAPQADDSPPAEIHAAQRTVASHLGAEARRMGFSADLLATKPNPNGEGVFVYSTRTRFAGVRRTPVWLQYRGTVYALNGPAYTLTEGQLSWPYPRTGERSDWEASGLLPSPTSAAVELVY